MNFAQFCSSFDYKIYRLLTRSEHDQIEEIDLQKVCKMFGGLANYDLHQEELKPFVGSVYMFFQLVISYAKQFPDGSFHKRQLSVKMALDTFSYVVDKTKIHPLIIKRFVKIIDNLIKENGEYGFIQEFLIVYVGCLSKVEQDTLRKLACKHKSIHLLANIARDAQETSIQAAIVELVLKFSYDTESPLLELMFPELKMSLVADTVNNYLKIRAILQQLNKNSTKIFSMNCTSIMLDHYLVSEFEGANSINEVWLDVDLPLKKLSFFCTPGFLSGFTDIRFGLVVDWEVLSFSVEDALEITFSYNEAVENLEIYIKIRTSKFNLFRDLQFDTIRHLVIQISRYSRKYNKFVKEIMPQVFSNFPAENFAYTYCKEVTSDDSTTNLFLQTSNESNRTVINRRYSDLDDTRLESVSVVDLTEDDEDEIEKQIQAVELSIDVTVEKTKWSRKQKMMDKSLSSVSFSETVLAGKRKSKLSRMNKKRKMSTTKKSNISASKERKPRPLKISTMTVSLSDHSPERDSPQIVSKAESEKLVEQNVEQAAPSNENNFEHSPFDDDLDLVVRDAVQETLELSQSKVENWLNTCMQSPVLLEGSPEFKTPEQRPVQVQYDATPASTHSSNQPLDQRITKWLSEGHYEPSKATRDFIAQKLSGRTESLLETLAKDDDNSTCIQTLVDMDVVTPTIIESKETEGKEIHPPIETNIINSDENKENRPNNSVDSESSNAPLAQLAGHWNKKSDDSFIIETRQLQIKLQRIDADKLDSLNETKAETEEDETSQKVNGVLSQTNKNSNTTSVPKTLSKTAASKQPKKSQKKAKNNGQNKKNLSVINEQISSAEASNRDLEDEQREGSLSKQLFEYIIDKEVPKSTNLSKPAIDKDTENHSPPTGNCVDIQKRPRKQTFRRRAEYLFDKLKNETTISMNTDTSAKNLSAKSDVADTSMTESRTEKRRLYNPNDLSYLENMITDDYINSKPEEKIPVIEIKERRSSTKKAPAAKKGRKKKIEELDDVDFTKLKTTITKQKPAEGTEKSFQKVIAEFKSQVKEHKKKKKMQKLINKSKRRGKNKVAVSSPSTVSSPESFGIPMETLLRKRSSDTSGEIPAKRVKEKDGSSKNINVISNIVIKEAETIQPEPSNGKFDNLETPPDECCMMYAKAIHRLFFEYITYTKRFNKKLFEEECFRKIVDVIKTDFLHN